MSKVVIESIVQYEKGTQSVWELTNMPIPDKMLIYAIDTKIVKLGNGTDVYADLPTMFDLNVAKKSQEFFNQFPELTLDSANGILRVTSDSNYTVSSIQITSTITKDELDGVLLGLSDTEHDHPEYYTPQDIENILDDLTISEDDDIINYLALREVDLDESEKLDTLNGYVDEFYTSESIDMDTSTGFTYDNTKKAVSGVGEVSSKDRSIPNVPDRVAIFYRGKISGDMSDYEIDISRDGGVTWSPAAIKRSSMSHGDFLLGTGVCEFDGVRETQEIGYDDIDIPDLKGDVTTFTVDGEGVGHVDTVLPDTVGVGCDIITSGGTVRIGAVDGDGTEAGSITYVGDVDSTEVSVEAIYAMGIDPVIVGRMGDVEYKTDMPVAIYGHTATLYQNKIYVIGGRSSNDNSTNTTYIYDIASDSWSQGTDIPVAIRQHTATLYQDKIYMIGGYDDSNSVNTTYIYDIATDSWSQGTDIPVVTRLHTATLYQDKIYVIGGYSINDGVDASYIYDIITDTWSQGTDIPVAIRQHTATLYQDKIYVIGGWDGNTIFNTTYIYDIATDTWSQGTDMPVVTRLHTATLYQDKIYVMGGQDNSNNLNITYIYDIITNSWSQGTDIPVAIRTYTATLYKNQIYVIGGYDGNNTVNAIYTYSLPVKVDALQPKRVEIKEKIEGEVEYKADVPLPVYYHTATIYQDKIYVMGGKYSSNHYNTTYIYDIASDSWSQGTDIPIAIIHHTATLYQDKLYVIGGRPDDSNILNTTYIYDIASDSWSQGTDIPITIYGHTATLYQDKIYVMGGWNGNDYLKTTYIYDIASDSWSQGTDIPISIYGHTATLYQDKIYVIGGRYTNNYRNTTYIYDIASDSWSQGANIPIAIGHHTATLYQDQIYIIGGRDGSNGYNTTYIYDIATDTWSQGIDIPTIKYYHASVLYQDKIYVIRDTTYTYQLNPSGEEIYGYKVVDTTDDTTGIGRVHMKTDVPVAMYSHATTLYQNKLYVIGGRNSSNYLNTTYIYDIATDSWSQGTNMPIAIRAHTAKLYQNQIYILGGYDSSNSVNTTYIYDIASDSWSQGTDMPTTIHYHTTTLYQDKIYVIGGILNGGNRTNTTYIYDIASDSWSQGTNVPVTIGHHTATLYQDKLYVIGGRPDDSNILNTTYIYDIASDSWSQGANIPISTYAHTATLYQDQIYMMGGYDGNNNVNTTHIYDIATDTWLQGTDIPIAVSVYTATLYQDKIYVIGGYNNSNSLNIIYTYSLSPYPVYSTITTSEIDIVDTLDVYYYTKIIESNNKNSAISYTLKFNDEYQIYKNNQWKSVVRQEAGTYQYLSDTDTWTDATTNSLQSAINTAMSIPNNRMDSTVLNNILSTDLTEAPTKLTVTFVNPPNNVGLHHTKIVGLNKTNIPEGRDIRWRFKTHTDQEMALHGMRIKW